MSAAFGCGYELGYFGIGKQLNPWCLKNSIYSRLDKNYSLQKLYL